MTPEQKAAYIMAQAASLMAEVAGMQAENQMRAHRGEALAYPEQAFADAVEHHVVGHNEVVLFFREDAEYIMRADR